MVGFRAHAFKVLTDDGALPWLAVDDRGWKAYSCRVSFASQADMDAMEAEVSVITELPASGMVGGGIIVVEAGTGQGALVLPTSGGGERAFNAILVSMETVAFRTIAGYYQADLEFRIRSEIV